MKELMEKRRESMPLNHPSAGSIFRNPEGDFAGRLIDQAGCKGMRRGDAQVSDLHANHIVNLGQATAGDVLELISHIQNVVNRKFGIQLELEVSLLS
jgi:UDP-N-acetylmuramate dehydrogenase